MAKSKKNKRFVVKIQRSLFTSEEFVQILIYNKSRSIYKQLDATEELIEVMGTEAKKFCYATYGNKNLTIGEDAPWQDW
jgi:hypothetical protein